MNNIRTPVSPNVYFGRIYYAAISLAVLQFIHLVLFTSPSFGVFIVWFFVNSFSISLLYYIRIKSVSINYFYKINFNYILIILCILCVIKIYSRLPYIAMFLSDGLKMARESDEVIVGGWISYINIFFNPAAILFSLANIRKKLFYFGFIIILTVCGTDLIFLGTRNSPAFVLMFYLFSFGVNYSGTSGKIILTNTVQNISNHISMPGNKKIKIIRRISIILAVAVVAVFLFNYSTINRTQEATEGNFDWLVLFEFTGSTEILRFDLPLMKSLNETVPMLMPVIFLSHYLTHSVAELHYLLDYSSFFGFDSSPYALYQLCPIIKCDKYELLQIMEMVNPRAGKYQTFFGSILIDFGYFGCMLILALIIFFAYHLSRRRKGECNFLLPTFSMLILLSPVENFLYNGLGLLQIAAIIPLYIILKIFR